MLKKCLISHFTPSPAHPGGTHGLTVCPLTLLSLAYPWVLPGVGAAGGTAHIPQASALPAQNQVDESSHVRFVLILLILPESEILVKGPPPPPPPPSAITRHSGKPPLNESCCPKETWVAGVAQRRL